MTGLARPLARKLTRALPRSLVKGVAATFNYYWSPTAVGGGDGTWVNPWTLAEVAAKAANFFQNKRLGMMPGTVDATTQSPALARSDSNFYHGAANSYGIETTNVLDDHILDASALISGSWTNVATNIWQKTVTQISDSSASGNILHDGVPGIIVQNRAALTSAAAAGYYFVAAWGWQGVAGITATTSLVIETYATSDPGSDGVVRRYSKDQIFNLTGNNQTIKNIHAKNSVTQSGNFKLSGTDHTLDGITCENGSRHGMLSGGGALVATNCTFKGGRNRQESGSGDFIVVNRTTFTGSDTATFINCVFEGGSYLAASGDVMSTLYAHDSGSGRMASVVFSGCTWKTNASGIAPGSALAFTFTSPVFINARRLIGESSGDVTITITGATGTIGEGMQSNASSGTMTINTSDMDITIDTSLTSGSGVKAWLWSKNSGYIVNWTGLRDKIKHSGTTGSRQVANLAKGSVRNNFCDYSGVSTIQIYWEIANGSTGGSYDHASNDNTFKSGVATGAWKVNATTYNTLAALQAGETPADTRSVVA